MKRGKLLQRNDAGKASFTRISATAAIAAVLVMCAGCAEKRPRAFPWATAINVRPRAPVPAPGYKPPPIDESAPDLPWDFAPGASRLIVIRQPARPRVAASAPQGPTETVKTEAPMLAPQLSEQEVSAAQQQMNESIAVAQRNLANAKNHQLNATQTDLASKVNSFLDESKTAVKDGDWTRAKNLAKKAEVLSQEFAQSL
jgi:hypothetical protein